MADGIMNRRWLLAATALAACLPDQVNAQAKLTDDGIYTQPWFVDGFLDLREDMETAAKAGKRFMVMFELKGCPYCKDVHVINFADEAIRTYVRERFDIVQLNILGAREVTDFDGEKLTEKKFAEKYGVKFTPHFLFFGSDAKEIVTRQPMQRPLAQWQGYLKPEAFRRMFAFVADKEYANGAVLRDYLTRS